MIWKALVMMFGFWVVLAAMFLLIDLVLQWGNVKIVHQEKIHAIAFIVLFFLWWGLFYLWFVY